MKTIYLGGGCFWGIEGYFQKIKGIIDTDVYYLNGGFEGVSYRDVCNASGHVEAVELIYDETLISSKEIWNLFSDLIDPYSINKQGNDRGVQYRSGIYAKDKAILDEFKKYNKEFEVKHGRKTAFEFKLINDKTRAEEYHQNYLIKNPNGYCHIDINNIEKKYLKTSF
ncbi:peptide-methionine (S)-S-oxide reductase MsrA [[Mycoplasma] mobile]|nr:peptide-methionine (S)-S-oxide reductase MsrA [[Mycoplasma] mobile]